MGILRNQPTSKGRVMIPEKTMEIANVKEGGYVTVMAKGKQ
jgi:hypothetical protein